MGARNPAYDLQLEEGVTYFTTDGCGVETIDFDTRERRPSRKADVGIMARISDYLPSIGFIWPMVSAQDHGETAPLHEIETAWNNSVKHVQSETVMGEIPCRYAVEMATVICRQPGRDATQTTIFAGCMHHRTPGAGYSRYRRSIDSG